MIEQVDDAPRRKRVTRQKPKKRESTGIRVEASKKHAPEMQPIREPEPIVQTRSSLVVAPNTQPEKAYRLRSKTSSLAVEYSNEGGRLETELQQSEEIARMPLSETRFCKHVDQRRFASSTPYSAVTTTRKGKLLDFDDSHIVRSASHVSTSTIKSKISHESMTRMTTMSRTSVSSDQKSFVMQDPEEEVMEEEESESQETGMEAGGSEEEGELEFPAWLQLGWKECVLASFLTGMGVVGYLCYCSDFCHYC